MNDANIKGYLKITVLRLLADKDKTGYELMNELEQLYNKRPSAGSMYPLLKELNQKKYIKSIEDGRKKTHHITNSGRKKLKELMEYQHNKIIKTTQLLQESVACLEEEDKILIKAMNKESKLALDFMLKGSIEFTKFKKEILKILASPNFSKKKKEVQKILEDATKKLSELNKK